MKEELFKTLETPCIVIDKIQTEKNIVKMQSRVGQCCKLRPHIKTHKMTAFAKMQIDKGACGISCAKVSEAEIMSEVCNDIFIAYPLIGKVKIKRAIELQKKLDRLILAVDSYDGAMQLNDQALKYNVKFEVRLEIDTGAKRTGSNIHEAVNLGMFINNLENLDLTGIYTFKSLMYQNKVTTNKYLAAEEEGELMANVKDEFLAAGLNIKDVSAGSTPTGIEVAKNKAITEVRPGTYVFYDYMMFKENACEFDEITCRFYATVVSVPSNEYCVIDGGTKTFPMDIILNVEPYYYTGYAYIEGREDIALTKMYEEHGIITSKNSTIDFKVGDVIELVPIHICTAINMQNEVYLYDGENLSKERISARGMLV